MVWFSSWCLCLFLYKTAFIWKTSGTSCHYSNKDNLSLIRLVNCENNSSQQSPGLLLLKKTIYTFTLVADGSSFQFCNADLNKKHYKYLWNPLSRHTQIGATLFFRKHQAKPIISVDIFKYVLCAAENLAIQGKATQSSLHSTGITSASNAIDGNRNTPLSTCAHTASDLNPWWRLNLGKTHKTLSANIR